MNPDILKPEEENLFCLAAEMGLVVMAEPPATSRSHIETESEPIGTQPKPFSQLT